MDNCQIQALGVLAAGFIRFQVAQKKEEYVG